MNPEPNIDAFCRLRRTDGLKLLDGLDPRLKGLLSHDSMFPWRQAGVTEQEQSELYYSIDQIQLRDDRVVASALASAVCEPT